MAKPPKDINFSEIFKSVDSELSLILKECNNGSSIKHLKENEIEKLKNCLFTIMKQNNVEPETKENIAILKNSINLLFCILHSNISNKIKEGFVSFVKYINSDELITEDFELNNLISKVNEYWMVKIQTSEEIEGMEYFTLKHLLNLCTAEKPLVSDIQRLSAIRKSITSMPFDKTVPSLRSLLVKLTQNLLIVSSEHGQKFIAHALVLSQKIMMEIHKTIMLDLSSCNKKKATDYGKIYVLAWQVSSESMRKTLEKACFQHLMESMLKEQRTSLELNKNSQNIITVLEVWHSERKKKNHDFITMITNAYQPILWKYLNSGFNVHRCNATDLFFKAFPLQRSDDTALEAEALFNKQYDVMLASLKDDCHIIRIIGIREVCNILSLYWNSFSPAQIQNLMSVITKQNANDASTAEVRRMVYIGFQNLVKSPLSREYAKQILPNLANNIHDINQKVRIAFFQLLLCIKELKDPNFKYSDCVSMFNIQYRLAEDNVAVGQWIVKLLMKNYYHSKMPVVEWTKRFIYLIKTYRNSFRNFFFYSIKSLPFEDSCTIICEILSQLGAFVISRLKVDEENNENPKEIPRKKQKKNKLPLTEQNGSQNGSKVDADSFKKCAFDDAEVVSGLFDIVTILWVLHDVKLNKPENEEMRFKIYETYIKYAQPLINYYKDCSIFLGVITLSGNIPASLLRSNSITLPGYCIKMLKTIQVNGSEEENEKIISMLIALVKWGRGSEILEQITLWLDAAFETKDMNETILPRRRVRINEGIQPNSIVAIYILDVLMKKEYVKLSILKKNYNELFSLWKFMSRIRKLIETRIEQGEPFEEDLVTDEFLNRCFERYVKLIPLLRESDSSEEKENKSQNSNSTTSGTTNDLYLNRQNEIENVIEWGENFLFPLLQGEELVEADAKLIVTALEDILYVADNMIIVHMVSNAFLFKVGHFVVKLLGTRYGLYFIKAASRVTVALNFTAKLLFKVTDDLQIFSTVVPSLLSHTLNALTGRKLTPKENEKLENDMPLIKTCFGKILATYQDNLSSRSGLKESVRELKLVMSFFVDCILNLISSEVPREDSTIPLYSTPSQMPLIANSLFLLFHNKKSWAPLFVHIINTKLSKKDLNAKDTVCCILLLNLCAASDKKVNEKDLKKTLELAHKHLNDLQELLKEKEPQVNELFSVSETKTGTKTTWPSNAATKGTNSSCTNLNSKTDEICDVQEESLDADEEDQKTEEKSEMLLSFQCSGSHLEVDFINCGFELVKNIENMQQEHKNESEDTS